MSSDNGANYTPISGSIDTTTTHIVDNLSNGTEYNFAVRAVNCPANGAAAMVSETPLFAAPAGLTATAGYGEVTLTWEDPLNSNITGYEVSSDGGTNYSLISGSMATTTNHTVTGLSGGTSYTFAVRAEKGAAAMVSETPLFAAPTGLTTTAGYGEVTLTWDDPDNSNITGYEVSSDGGTNYSLISGSMATTTNHTVTGLSGGTSHTFSVRAVNDLVDGEPSVQVSATPLFAAPTGLQGTAGDEQVTLIWADPDNNNIRNYQLKINNGDFADILNSDANTISHTATGLTNGTTYTFAVRAVNASLTGAAEMVNATPGTPPPPVPGRPGNLTATPDDRAVALSWTAAANNDRQIIKYQHRRSGVGWEDVPGGPTATEVTVSGLTNGAEYVFYVRAVNSVGNGVPASVRATPAAVPDAPRNLTATADDGAIALIWTAAEDNGSPIIKYQHQQDGGPWGDVAGGEKANSLAVTGLVNGAEYVFHVRAVNSVGNGVPASVTAIPAAVPDAPSNLTATADDGAIALTWTAAEDNGSPIIKYQHQRDGAPWEDVAGGVTANSLQSLVW